MHATFRRTAAIVVVLIVGTAGIVIAQDKPTTKRSRPLRVTLPYSLLQDMTEAQRSEIVSIRTDIMEQIKALKIEEKRRIMAVLTEEQRARLPELEAERKLKQAEKARDRAAGEGDAAEDDVKEKVDQDMAG